MGRFDNLPKTVYNNRNGKPKDQQTPDLKVGAWDMEQITGKVNELAIFSKEAFDKSVLEEGVHVSLVDGTWKKGLTTEQVSRLQDLVYINLDHSFVLNVSLIEKGESTVVKGTYNVSPNDDTISSYIIDSNFISSENLDGNDHVKKLTSTSDTRLYRATLDYVRKGTNYTMIIDRVVEAVYATFYGKNTDGDLPTEIEITAGTKKITKTNLSITINPNTEGNEYGWFAVDKTQTGKTYTNWYIAQDNYGTIADGHLVKHGGEVTVNSRTYDVYIYSFSSEVKQNIKLS
jgi:hypothetical protein